MQRQATQTGVISINSIHINPATSLASAEPPIPKAKCKNMPIAEKTGTENTKIKPVLKSLIKTE